MRGFIGVTDDQWTSDPRRGSAQRGFDQGLGKGQEQEIGSISSLTLKLYDPSDGFKLLGLVGSVPKADKQVSIHGEYETTEGSELSIEFKGKVQDAQPVKDFLGPQLRAAKDKDVNITFDLTFNPGLSLPSEEPENIS